MGSHRLVIQCVVSVVDGTFLVVSVVLKMQCERGWLEDLGVGVRKEDCLLQPFSMERPVLSSLALKYHPFLIVIEKHSYSK